MVKIRTKAYGLIEVDERQKITFPQGLFGFEGLKDYVLMDAQQKPFFWLQSLDVEKVAFVLIDPFIFREDYELNISDDELSDIKLDSYDKALVFAIVTIPEEGPMTANLQGPLIINRETREGKQAVLTDLRWNTKHDIVAELNAAGKAAEGGE